MKCKGGSDGRKRFTGKSKSRVRLCPERTLMFKGVWCVSLVDAKVPS